MIYIEKLINNLSILYKYFENKSLCNLTKDCHDIPHINLYGGDGSMKNFYAYFIINQLNGININTNDIKLQEDKILIKNNTVSFKINNHKYFKEINLYHKMINSKNILKYYILPIIKNKNFHLKKHIFIIKDFDKLNFQSFMLLRRVMEIYSHNVLFIFVSSTLSNIPDSIKSRCINIRCPLLESPQLVKLVQKIIKNPLIEKNEIKKLVKNSNNDIYNILLNLDNLIKNDNTSQTIGDKDNKKFTLKDTLLNGITKHLSFLKKEKNQFKVLIKNREFIFKLINFNFNNQIILECFLKILIKKYHKHLDLTKITKITSQIEEDIIASSRESYHYEKYLLNIYKLFNNID